MSNNIIKYTILGFVVIGMLWSCTQNLDLEPRTSLSEATFWQAPNDFKSATNRYYGTLLPGHGPSDANSDITYENGQNSTSAGTLIPSENDGTWNSSYTKLRQINTMLQKAEEYNGDPSDIATSVAEGKFFRAYTYFRLVERFGDVPYFDRPLTGLEDEAISNPRTPRETVISNVLQDLDESIAALPMQSDLSGSDVGRITQGAALALKARVALFEATWAKYHGTSGNVDQLLDLAIAAANQVIDSDQYALFVYAPAPEESHLQSYMLPGNDSPEQILARRYHPDVQGHAWGHWLCCGGRGDATKKLADMYACTDGLPIDISPLFQGYDTPTSEYENRDYRMANTIALPGSNQISRANQDGADQVYPRITGDEQTGYRVRKLVSVDPDGFIWGRNHEFKHVLKYSEVLLNLAEALYEKNGAITDTDLNRTINLLRDRGGVAALTNALASDNGLNMRDEIRRERTIELAYDGFRLSDLRRWKTAVDELNQHIRGVNLGNGSWNEIFPDVDTSYPMDADGFRIVEDASTRQFADKNYLFPLPTQQIQLSDGVLTQNPGW
jgi:hypothetical protein